MKKLKRLQIDKLALVPRGANKVNRSVLKSEDLSVIFKEESAEEIEARKKLDNPEEIIKSSEILEDICGVYEVADGEVKNKLGEIIKFYDGKLPEIEQSENEKSNIRLVTADEILKEL